MRLGRLYVVALTLAVLLGAIYVLLWAMKSVGF